MVTKEAESNGSGCRRSIDPGQKYRSPRSVMNDLLFLLELSLNRLGGKERRLETESTL